MLQEHYQSTPKMHQILKESVARVHSMALIHEKLYQSPKFSQIQSSEYFENLIRDLSASYQINPQKIRIRTQLENIPLKIDTAIPLGLILTELLTNAFKYAFKGKKPGNIYLEMGRNKDEICLLVEDNGKGLPEKFNPENAQTLGLNLVRSLTTQLNGTVDFQSHAGLKVLIRFPYLFSAED
jgi:two-component sensor histidine kinase